MSSPTLSRESNPVLWLSKHRLQLHPRPAYSVSSTGTTQCMYSSPRSGGGGIVTLCKRARPTGLQGDSGGDGATGGAAVVVMVGQQRRGGGGSGGVGWQ